VGLVGLKGLGDFSKGVSDRLASIQKRQSTSFSTFSGISSELDVLVFSTGVDPEKFLSLVKRDSRFRKDVERFMNDASKSSPGVDSEVVSSIVDSALTLELMKAMVSEAGGEGKLLDYLKSKYGVGLDEIALEKRLDDLETARIESFDEFRKYFEEGLSELGLSKGDIFYPLTVMHTGVVLAAKYSGRVVGLLDMMFDRDGGCFIHNVCVSKAGHGLGVLEKLLSDVGEYCRGRRVWSAVNAGSESMLSAFLEAGYAKAGLVRDFYGTGEDAFIVEAIPEVLGVKQAVMPQERAMGPYRMRVLQNVEEIMEAQVVDELAFGAKKESVHTLMLMARVGVFLGVFHDKTKKLVGITPLIFDGGDGVFAKSIGVVPTQPREKVRALVLGELDGILEAFGRGRAWLTLSPVDLISTSLLLNQFNFVGKMLVLDYYGKGEHRLVVERSVHSQGVEYEYRRQTPYLKTYFDFQPEYRSCLVDADNFGLMRILLSERGFDVVQVIPKELNRRNVNVEKDLYLLNRA